MPLAIVPDVPDGLAQILMLAGLIVFSITVVAAILSSLFVKRESLFYLGTQLFALSLFVDISVPWAYPLWFGKVFASAGQMLVVAETLLLLSAAYTIDMGLRVAVWEGILRRHGQRAVPPLLIAATRVVIYLLAALVILQFVYHEPITALVTLSGAFALILGLSAQSTLGEMFSGIAIALSRPFRIGDWVRIGTLDEGRVIEMTWRMVRVETRDKIVLNVPNRSVADQTVQNFSYPTDTIRLSQTIYFAATEEPGVVQDLLHAAVTAAEGTLADPPPNVLYRGTKEGVAEYSMRYYIDDYGRKDTVTESVWKNVVDRIARSPFKIAYPHQFIAIGTVAGDDARREA